MHELPHHTFTTTFEGEHLTMHIGDHVNRRWFNLFMCDRMDLEDNNFLDRITALIDCSTMAQQQFIVFSIKPEFADACPESLELKSEIHEYYTSGQNSGQVKKFSVWMEGITHDEFLIGLLTV